MFQQKANNLYLATISVGGGRLSAHRQNFVDIYISACSQPNNSTATISALNLSKNATVGDIQRKRFDVTI